MAESLDLEALINARKKLAGNRIGAAQVRPASPLGQDPIDHYLHPALGDRETAEWLKMKELAKGAKQGKSSTDLIDILRALNVLQSE